MRLRAVFKSQYFFQKELFAKLRKRNPSKEADEIAEKEEEKKEEKKDEVTDGKDDQGEDKENTEHEESFNTEASSVKREMSTDSDQTDVRECEFRFCLLRSEVNVTSGTDTPL